MVISHVIDGLFGRILVMFAWVNKNAVFFSDVGFLFLPQMMLNKIVDTYHIYIYVYCEYHDVIAIMHNVYYTICLFHRQLD